MFFPVCRRPVSSCCWGTVGSAFKTFFKTSTARLQVAGITMLGDTSRDEQQPQKWKSLTSTFSLTVSQPTFPCLTATNTGWHCPLEMYYFVSISSIPVRMPDSWSFPQQCDNANSSNCALAFQTPSIAMHREILTCFLHRKVFSGQIEKKCSRSPRGQWQRNKPFE